MDSQWKKRRVIINTFSPPIEVGVISQLIYIVNKERCICYAKMCIRDRCMSVLLPEPDAPVTEM